MFQNILSSSPLTWAGLAGLMVALPILIHLINMMRHRRVRWAAMDFLLQSHKRNRNWIWLKQLLLLLCRIAVLLLGLLMLGQIGCQSDELSRLTQGRPTHHFIIIDDTYSMGERVQGQRIFDRALNTVELLAARSANVRNQRLSMVSLSSLADVDVDSPDFTPGNIAIASGLSLDSGALELIKERQTELTISDLAMGPTKAFSCVEKMMAANEGESAIVYFVSDFRATDWRDTTAAKEVLNRIEDAGGRLHFISCVDSSKDNLEISELAPTGSLQVSNVPMFMTIRVRNHGQEPVENVQVEITRELYNEQDKLAHNPGDWEPNTESLPAVFFERIPAGEEAEQQFPIYFPVAGDHVVRALLRDNSLDVDNERTCVVPCRNAARVLIVEDGRKDQTYFLQTAFSPGTRNTGYETNTSTYGGLQSTSLKSLLSFDTIVLTNVPSMQVSLVNKLEEYVKRGGSICLIVGPKTDFTSYSSSLYKNGSGLSPMPLEQAENLVELIDESAPDIVATNDPTLRIFGETRNSLLTLVTLKTYARAPLDWSENESDQLRVLARVRDSRGVPLITMHPFGAGQVALINTTSAPEWNDWAANPTFVVMVLRVQEALLKDRSSPRNIAVGSPVFVERTVAPENKSYVLNVPSQYNQPSFTVDGSVDAATEDEAITRIAIGASATDQNLNSLTLRDGVYSVWTDLDSSQREVDRFAVHLAGDDSDLELIDSDRFSQELGSLNPVFERWNDITTDVRRDLSSTLSLWFLFVLIAILLFEQLLAYLLSYHPKPGGASE